MRSRIAALIMMGADNEHEATCQKVLRVIAGYNIAVQTDVMCKTVPLILVQRYQCSINQLP